MLNLRVTMRGNHIDVTADNVDRTQLDRLVSVLCIFGKVPEIIEGKPQPGAYPGEPSSLHVVRREPTP